jgi:hypothetical protein
MRNFPVLDTPNVRKRDSPVEWSGSLNVRAIGSPKTVPASWKDTPCLRRLADAFLVSHSSFTGIDQQVCCLAQRYASAGAKNRARNERRFLRSAECAR